MKITVLASGSKGNCICVEGGSGTILVDAGISNREIRRRMAEAGADAGDVEGLFLTHEHSDHIRGADVFCRGSGVPVYGTEGTLGGLGGTLKKPGALSMHAVLPGAEVACGDFFVTAFRTSHDAAEPSGFCIREGDVTVGVCTDTGMVTSGMLSYLKRCDAVILESNHCPLMLAEGRYPAFLKRRIADRERGHLSNPAAAAVLRELCDGLSHVVLAHLSEENNTPEKALATAHEGVGLYAGNLDVGVARQHTISDSFEV
ncbi:MBL fold metallo-hydrolase [Methanomicrobiaceae archaeon CYW5]|uniref:MBL fold metallo-hydrolase n=1 Tax=Methanovulcanius yangii TaxID=1789227 RepID=UPI0029CA8EEA|nr:MBL fold metallo-hydrolase [Methanovulcanius yangii]MBT8508147.1 MBL fold metallo-hydrolase [Methanovulcanius yangii]